MSDSLEDDDTLKSRLQRGLGSAFLEVVARRDEPGIRDLVIDTVLATEGSGTPFETDTYYANLFIKADIDPTPLYQAIQGLNRRDQEDADTSRLMTVMVVCNLAVSGVPAAMDVALGYVSRGMWWPSALEILAPGGSDARALGLMNTLLARFPTTRLLVRNRVCCQKVTASWRGRDRRIDAALDAHPYFHARKGPPPPPVLGDLSTRDLLHEARWFEGSSRWEELGRRTTPEDRRLMIEALNLPPVPRRTLFEDPRLQGDEAGNVEIVGPIAYAALRGLAAQADAELIPVFRDVASQDPGERNSMTIPVSLEVLTRLAPREALSIARRLRENERWQLTYAAGQAVAGHGEIEDLEWLRQKLRNPEYPWTDETLARLMPLFERFRGTGPYPELPGLFRRVISSADRWRVCKAIAATDPDFANSLAVECLWDASPAVRSIAIEHVTLASDAATRRLAEIAGDPLEHPWNARTAARRLNDAP
jgi:hypothetical protein